MRALVRLGWIAAGYAAAAGAATLAIVVRYRFADPADVAASSGMYAGGDLIWFVLIAGTLSLVPTFFLVRLALETAPRALAAAFLALGATGPVSLWLLASLSRSPAGHPGGAMAWLGLVFAFLIFPRVVATPVVFALLALALLLAKERTARALVAVGLLLEGASLSVLVVHFARALSHR